MAKTFGTVCAHTYILNRQDINCYNNNNSFSDVLKLEIRKNRGNRNIILR